MRPGAALSDGSPAGAAHALVVDVGKTNTRLLAIGADGEVLAAASQRSASYRCDFGYDALDTGAAQHWLQRAILDLGPLRASLRQVIVSAHGAALAALRDDALAFPVPDYESACFDDRDPGLGGELDAFDQTLSPLLPRGLNLGVQLDWLQRNAPEAADRADTLLPYAQYWAWWWSGAKATEASSLGCHTLLWRPREGVYSHWAIARGWARRFAPLRGAWEVLGPVRPALAAQLGLPRDLQVHVGVHDSNACLARYLRAWPSMTLVSTGTWVVVMAPGAAQCALEAGRDQLGNVSVRGDLVPTGRFMGGREIGHLCAGADPGSADISRIAALLRRGVRLLPSFEPQGGAFAQCAGRIRVEGRDWTLEEWARRLDSADRATAAALYAAQMIAWTIRALCAAGPIVLEGPLSRNAVVGCVLAALFPERDVVASADALEGTARGAWLLTRWTVPASREPAVEAARCPEELGPILRADWDDWCTTLAHGGPHAA